MYKLAKTITADEAIDLYYKNPKQIFRIKWGFGEFKQYTYCIIDTIETKWGNIHKFKFHDTYYNLDEPDFIEILN